MCYIFFSDNAVIRIPRCTSVGIREGGGKTVNANADDAGGGERNGRDEGVS